jgi:hypothetical protein
MAALPVTPSGSPFDLFKDPGTAGAPPIQATGACAVVGGTIDEITQEPNFSAMLDQPFQTVVSVLPANGSITDTFAATIDASKLGPDGGYMLESGLGLILLSLGSRRLLGRREAKADREAMVGRSTSRPLRAIIGLPDESARIRFSEDHGSRSAGSGDPRRAA